eukprot:gene2481-17529_t
MNAHRVALRTRRAARIFAARASDPDKWVVWLNGGGWCFNEGPTPLDPHSMPGGPDFDSWGKHDSCWGRSRSSLGSSGAAYHAPTMPDPLAATPMAGWNDAGLS